MVPAKRHTGTVQDCKATNVEKTKIQREVMSQAKRILWEEEHSVTSLFAITIAGLVNPAWKGRWRGRLLPV